MTEGEKTKRALKLGKQLEKMQREAKLLGMTEFARALSKARFHYATDYVLEIRG